MQYKTIALSLLEAEPRLYERLRASRTLLSTMERHARELRDLHQARIEQLRRMKQDGSPEQIRSEALEMAIGDLRPRFEAASSASDPATT